MSNFIIYSSPRSGSSWICDFLNCHPHIVCLGEIFHNSKLITGADNSFNKDIITNFNIEQKNERPFEYFRHLKNNSSAKHFGFKVFPRHAKGVWKKFLSRPNFQHVFLYRENKLAQFSSLLLARTTQIWISTNETVKKQSPKINFSVKEFKDFCKREDEYLDKFIQIISDKKIPHVCLSYESLHDKNIKNYLLNFIGIEKKQRDIELTSSLNIMNTPNICKRFVNSKDAWDYLKKIKKEGWRFSY